MAASDDGVLKCILDDNKACDDCGDCRCDLDPNKICDNCCKCLAIEDADGEFRTVTLNRGGEFTIDAGSRPGGHYEKPNSNGSNVVHFPSRDEPTELTPELVAYWESKLLEYGEAPADDGLGEVNVASRVPVKGVRKRTGPHRHGIRTND